MRVSLEDLMEKLEVGRVLGPYETCPWSYYAPEEGITCSAEVRMGSDNDEVEAEIQMMYETPPEGELPMQQICYIRATKSSDEQWEVKTLLIKGAPYEEDIYNKEEKACNFFCACVREIVTDTIPDVDDLLEREMHSRERYGGGSGGGGKSPKIKAGQLLGMKKGGGM